MLYKEVWKNNATKIWLVLQQRFIALQGTGTAEVHELQNNLYPEIHYKVITAAEVSKLHSFHATKKPALEEYELQSKILLLS